MAGTLRIELTTPRQSGTELAARRPANSAAGFGANAGLQWLENVIRAVTAGFGARIRTQVDESTGVKATGTFALTQATLLVGDVAGVAGVPLTAVTGAANAALGQWSKDTSDTACATSLAAAINAAPALKGIATATSSVGTVTVTAVKDGVVGNSIRLTKVGSAGIVPTGMSGGVEPGSLATAVLTFSGTGTAADTITIGGVVLTLVASAANENQITIGGTAAISATNTIAVINANTRLRGLVVASSGGSGIVNLQLQLAGRVGNLVTLAESGTGTSFNVTSFAPLTTEAWRGNVVTYSVGAV